jgi:prephenate dehydrogenase
VLDHATLDLPRAVAGADLIVLCTPIARMVELTQQMLPTLKPGVIMTDVGSVKRPLMQHLEPLLEKAGGCFVGCHPMAGAEKMGVKAARPDLFEKAICVLTPSPKSPPKAVRALTRFWAALGARTMVLSAAVHDQLVSRASHLPHIVAAELSNYVLDPALAKEQGLLCATGFRDTTRIASGSPEMWRDIAVANRANLQRVLSEFIQHLRTFQRALRRGDSRFIIDFFEQAKHRRDHWCEHCTTPE